jgi:hypothetical protein
MKAIFFLHGFTVTSIHIAEKHSPQLNKELYVTSEGGSRENDDSMFPGRGRLSYEYLTGKRKAIRCVPLWEGA